MRILLLIAVMLVAACATFDGRGLVPGTSTAAQVESAMGPAADKRVQANGETWVYYPRQPYGLQTYVARIAPDGRLAAVEQRLTDENVAKLERGKSRSDDVRNLFGPPYTETRFARMQRDVWEYRMRHDGFPVPYALYVQMSPDGVVREVYMISDPDYRLSDCCSP
jgi:hypothetical protein